MQAPIPHGGEGWAPPALLLALRRLPRRNPWTVVAFGLLPLLVAFLASLAPMSPEMLFRDPAVTAALPPYLGVFSHLGVLAWWAAATACLLSALVLPAGRERAMMAAAGAFAALLALDDLFMLHESLMPRLGVPEKLVLGSYAVLAITFLVGFRDIHRRMDWPLLLASLALLGLSVFVDVAFAYSVTSLVIEDGTKFAGIIAWSAYHLLAARHALRRALGTDGAPAG